MHIADMIMFYAPVSGGVCIYLEAKHHHLWHYPGIRHSMLASGAGYHQANGIHETPAPPLPFGNGYRFPLRRDPRRRVLCNLQLDLVEVGDPHLTAWAVLDARRRLDVSVIGFYHSDPPLLMSSRIGAWLGTNTDNYVSKLHGHFDRVLAPSRMMAEEPMRLGVVDVHVQPLSVDLVTFHPNNRDPGLRQELGLDEETRLLIFAGHGSREKNLSVLLDAIQRLGDGYHLLLAGSNMPTRVPRNTSVVDHFCDSREVARLLASSDVLPHAGDQETFGLVALEAMASGIPAVVVRAGVLAEIVPEHCGVLCAPSDGDAMAYAVCKLLSHDVELRGQRVRRHVERQHARDAVVTGLLLHYHVVLGDGEARFPRYG